MRLGSSSDVLAGLRVIEFSSFVAAPSAGLVLRQLGADVIRIDPLGGGPDIGRWPLAHTGQSIYWAGLNRGKRSVQLDFADEQTHKLVGELVSLPGPEAGIVLSNAHGRPWLSDEALRAHREDLIHVQVMGNSDGSPAVDYTVNASTGMALATGGPDLSRPVNHVLPAWDLLTGLYAALSILAAVEGRRLDHQGRHLTISLEDVALSTLTMLGFYGEVETTGAPRERIGNQVFGSFGFDVELADGSSVMIVALTPRQWRSLVGLTGKAGLLRAIERELGVDFADEGARYIHRDVLTAILRPWFESTDAAEVRRALADSNVLWSPYRDMREVVESLSHTPSPVLERHKDVHLGTLLATPGPIRARHAAAPAVADAPRPGADTADVLYELLGLDVRDDATADA